MSNYCTLKRGDSVVVHKKVHSSLSKLTTKDIGKTFTVKGLDHDGRRHNKYVAYIYLRGSDGIETIACVEELAKCNPNFEPTGEFMVCVGCGATMTNEELKVIRQLDNVKACPSCGILDPHES